MQTRLLFKMFYESSLPAHPPQILVSGSFLKIPIKNPQGKRMWGMQPASDFQFIIFCMKTQYYTSNKHIQNIFIISSCFLVDTGQKELVQVMNFFLLRTHQVCIWVYFLDIILAKVTKQKRTLLKKLPPPYRSVGKPVVIDD